MAVFGAWCPVQAWGCARSLRPQRARRLPRATGDNVMARSKDWSEVRPELGLAGCRAFIEVAKPEHPSLIDRHHVLADLFGVINIPSSVWIDEQGMIVRPAETAPAPPLAKLE